tara:strand:- start:98 stop:346 length:249 start_codon:yes stop_codon:yes gene_type:complete
MITLSQLTEFLGWVSILNIGMLLFAGFVLIGMKTFVTGVHSKLFSVPEEELPTIYFRYLSNYQTLTLIFAIAPYIALKIMGQ